MCYRKPGPRCSAHAAQAMEVVRKKLVREQKKLDELWDEHEQLPNDQKSENIDKNITPQQSVVRRYTASYQRLQEQYYATPKGLSELKGEVVKARKDGDARAENIAVEKWKKFYNLRRYQKMEYDLAKEHGFQGESSYLGPASKVPANFFQNKTDPQEFKERLAASPLSSKVSALQEQGFSIKPADHDSPTNTTVDMFKTTEGGYFKAVGRDVDFGSKGRKVSVSAWYVKENPAGKEHFAPSTHALSLPDNASLEDYEKAADSCDNCKQAVGRSNLKHVAFANASCGDCYPEMRKKLEFPGWAN